MDISSYGYANFTVIKRKLAQAAWAFE